MGKLQIQNRPLSVRAYNCLTKDGKYDIMDLAGLKKEDIYQIHSAGENTVDEIMKTLIPETRLLRIICTADNGTGKYLGCMLAPDGKQDFRKGTADEWVSVFGTDKEPAKGWAERWTGLDAAEDPGEEAIDVLVYPHENCERHQALAEQIVNTLREIGLELPEDAEKHVGRKLLAISCKREVNSIDTPDVSDIFFKHKTVTEMIDENLLRFMKQKRIPCTPVQLSECLPSPLRKTDTVHRSLARMQEKNLICEKDGLYERNLISLMDWLMLAENTRDVEMLRSKLMGETLEEIGKRYNLTRERVRQKIAKLLENREFFEDRYAAVYEQYRFEKEDAETVFSSITANYLSTRYSRGNAPLEDALQNTDISVELRRKIGQAVYRDYISVNGTLIRKNRPDIVNFVLREYCKEQCTIEEFEKKYAVFCSQYGLSGEKYEIVSASFINHLAGSASTLYALGKRFRYYPFEATDFTDLLDALELQQYTNAAYSALYFFRKHPDVMKRYDIHDEYELHNLLKKVIGEPNQYHLSFGRMPSMIFGTADTDSQVFDLMLEYAPITMNDLGARYEETYGVLGSTAIGSYFKCIIQYLDHGEYRIDMRVLPADVIDTMKSLLTEDFYPMETLRAIYKKRYPDAPAEDLNSYSIRSLGYIPCEGYVIRDTFGNRAQFFENLLLKDEMLDLDSLPAHVTDYSQFSSTLTELRQQFEIIEYEPRHYLRFSRFEQAGITKEQLEAYCRHVYEYPVHEKYFSIRSLRKSGFSDPLDSLGFDDWFYSSLLMQRLEMFTVQRVGGVRVICKERGAFSRTDFIESIVEQYGSIEIDDLMELMENEHGVRIPKDTVVEMIDAGGMYYDRIMKTVYIDRDTYYDLL